MGDTNTELEEVPMTERLSDAELARADELAANATPGPWEADLDSTGSTRGIWPTLPGEEIVVGAWVAVDGFDSQQFECGSDDNLKLIAFARTALPALVAEVRVLRGQVAEALRIEAWPYNPASMTGFELDQAEGYNDARREFRRALGVVSND